MQSPYLEDEQLAIAETLHRSLRDMDEIATRLYDWNWFDTTGGNMSIRLPQRPELFAITPSHTGFKRWKLMESGLTVLDHQLNLMPFSTGTRRAHPSAIVHATVYRAFPDAGAVLHAHAPYSLVFAAARRPICSATLHSQIIGDVPCLMSDADETRDRSKKTIAKQEERMTSGMQGYDYAYEHFKGFLAEAEAVLRPREEELKRHGLVFTVYQHGIFVVARNLDEAFDNLIRVERNAQIQLFTKLLP